MNPGTGKSLTVLERRCDSPSDLAKKSTVIVLSVAPITHVFCDSEEAVDVTVNRWLDPIGMIAG